MKIYPEEQDADYKRELSLLETITRLLALLIAFASVYFFFIKLLYL